MTVWIVGHNLTGYLPETDPYAYDDHASARDALAEDIAFHADHEEQQDTYDALRAAEAELLLVDMDTEWSTIIGNTSYWLSYSTEVESADAYNGEDN